MCAERFRRLRVHRKNFYVFITLVFVFLIIYFSWNRPKPLPIDVGVLDTFENHWAHSNGYKTILAYNLPGWFKLKDGVGTFIDLKCPVKKCRLTTKHSERKSADAVLFNDNYIPTDDERPPRQIYALYYIETPPHTKIMPIPDAINWTITYRYDSTIPAPYRKWQYYNEEVQQINQTQNYALNKTKKVAWFVSNCNDKNGRLKYALELQKYIEVDIYGKCGTMTCSRDTTQKCYDMLDEDYKFYLAFENSNCKHYITEKLFENALQRNILPIVMGAPIEDYELYAPKKSYIHVDEFESPAELAQFLRILDHHDDLYNMYFQWKGTGEITMPAKHFFCDMCAMLHDEQEMSIPKYYKDVNEWWRSPGICTTKSWRNSYKISASNV